MKKSLFFLLAILFLSLSATGCNRNNVNKNDVAYRNEYAPEVNDNDVRLGRNVNRYNENINNGRNGNINNDSYHITDDRNRNGNESLMRVADEAAKKVAGLPEVDTANVIITKNNAYVAVKLSPSSTQKITAKMEQKVSKQVKSVDRNIGHVYISENPDFYRRMNTYAADIRKGKPISGFFNEFNATISRVFPKAK